MPTAPTIIGRTAGDVHVLSVTAQLATSSLIDVSDWRGASVLFASGHTAGELQLYAVYDPRDPVTHSAPLRDGAGDLLPIPVPANLPTAVNISDAIDGIMLLAIVGQTPGTVRVAAQRRR